jgi:hypothetical protein
MIIKKIEDDAPPSEVARLAAENIASDLRGFDMSSWLRVPDGRVPALGPDTVPSVCGSALCAAGWIAHSLGWKIFPGGHAVRDGKEARVEDVAEAALKISPEDGSRIWFTSEERALKQLGRLANGLPLLGEYADGK